MNDVENHEPVAVTERVGQRLANIRERIVAAGGDPAKVSIVAVTKTFGLTEIRAALSCGVRLIGENRADELVAKAVAMSAEDPCPEWQFLGPLQTNKINRLCEHVACWQAIDSTHRAVALARRSPGAAVLLQIRLQEGGDRAGADPTEIPDLVRVASDHGLAVRGLMAVGPKNPAMSEASFRSLVALADRMALPIRSIGMSSDFEAAVRAGSTMVRLGASLFGARVE